MKVRVLLEVPTPPRVDPRPGVPNAGAALRFCSVVPRRRRFSLVSSLFHGEQRGSIPRLPAIRSRSPTEEAAGLEPACWGFESLRDYQLAPVAQKDGAPENAEDRPWRTGTRGPATAKADGAARELGDRKSVPGVGSGIGCGCTGQGPRGFCREARFRKAACPCGEGSSPSGGTSVRSGRGIRRHCYMAGTVRVRIPPYRPS